MADTPPQPGDTSAGDSPVEPGADSEPAVPGLDPDLADARQRAGKAIRELSHAFVGRHATMDQVERLADSLEAITDELWPQARRSRAEQGWFSSPVTADYPQGRFVQSYDERPISGSASPYGLDLDLHRHGDEIEALVSLRSAHEGAPERAHGGIVAALFDDVFGFVLGIIKQAAFTGDLYIRYHAPTPLFRELSCRVRLADRDGRKLHLTGELTDVDTGELCASAKATFIAVDPSQFSSLTAARPAPPDDDS